MSVKTVKVSNVSLSASMQDIREFFSFSGDIFYIEMKRDSERTQAAYITFKDSQGADTAVLLTGATIVDLPVTVTVQEGYQLPPEAHKSTSTNGNTTESAMQKAEDMMSTMLAKGFVLGKDALALAKSLDEQHKLTSNASVTIANLDSKIGLTDKLNTGVAIVNGKAREVDERYRVSEITRSALAAAEEKVTAAMSNPYVLSGASWVSSAFSRVTKAAGDVGSMAKEKAERLEEEKMEGLHYRRMGMLHDFAKVHLDDGPAVVPVVDSEYGLDDA